VQQTVHTRHHFDERTEVRDALDAAHVDLVEFRRSSG